MPPGSSWVGRCWKGQEMALTELQKKVLFVIVTNRSQESYLVGGAVLNMDWPRNSRLRGGFRSVRFWQQM